jgi:hypothetical protein
MFLALFFFEGSQTLSMIYGRARANELTGTFLLWLVIGGLSVICSSVLTWITVRKEKKKERGSGS